jgi:ribosomal protection tetracycline resistance protein
VNCPVKCLTLGIVAHVDAGKTSLTERLLQLAGVIDEVGSVDRGSTQTDTLALERQRGITIRSAVVSFVVGDTTVDLVDTPGHSDFIAEVERVLGVLDGAVLVVSAVEGVQAQTRVLMRALQRLRIPTVVFVNKADRGGADLDRVLRELAERLTPAVLAMVAVQDQGTREVSVRPYQAGDPDHAARTAELLAEHDDALLAEVVDTGTVRPDRLHAALVDQTRRALVHPVYAGSAITGAGVEVLVGAVTRLLPPDRGDADAPCSGAVFKVERGEAGEKVAYVRMFAGTLRVRDRLPSGDRVTALRVFERGGARRRTEVSAGRIAQVWGLASARIGDPVGEPRPGTDVHEFDPPTLETVVDARDPKDRAALHAALVQLAEQDPMVALRQDDVRQEISVSLYGEVQKEVLEATLAEEYGVPVTFRETTTICVERVRGTGSAVEVIDVPPNPFLATVGLRVEPAPVGAGVRFRLEVELGSMPPAFFTAVEESARATLRQGLHGWEVPDCVVTMTHAGYWARQSHAHGTFDASMSSTAGDFRHLTPLVLATALRRAGTEVAEPVLRFELEVPADALGAVLGALARRSAVPLRTEPRSAGYLLTGEVPAARVHRLQQELPALTGGESQLLTWFDHHRPVQGPPPSRPRTDLDPLHRREYLLRLSRRT